MRSDKNTLCAIIILIARPCRRTRNTGMNTYMYRVTLPLDYNDETISARREINGSSTLSSQKRARSVLCSKCSSQVQFTTSHTGLFASPLLVSHVHWSMSKQLNVKLHTCPNVTTLRGGTRTLWPVTDKISNLIEVAMLVTFFLWATPPQLPITAVSTLVHCLRECEKLRAYRSRTKKVKIVNTLNILVHRVPLKRSRVTYPILADP